MTVQEDPALDDDDATDPVALGGELTAERTHLAEARAWLRRMHEHTSRLDAPAGDEVSAEYLKAALHRRTLALADDPSTPLFFGRLDYRQPRERFYVGRRHVHDDAGDPVVVDWRADISRAFYRASGRDPMGLTLRRRFGFSGGQLTAYEDEAFGGGPDARPGAGPTVEPGTSRILVEEIERPRMGPMRDIVATIQPDQDHIVRADLDDTICVQGAPGTGKTAVGLHRAAYLLYAYRARLRRGGVLIVGPNRAFLGYIAQVLPALGEVDVAQVTLDALIDRVTVRVADEPAAATVKGDARMAEVLRRALWSRLREPGEALVVPRGARRWRVSRGRLAGMLEELRSRGLRYGAGRALLPRLVASAVVEQMEASGDAPGERALETMARSRPVTAFVDQVWPAVRPVDLVFRLLSDSATLAQAADGLLDGDELRAIGWTRPPRSPRSALWSLADAVLVDEAADLIERVPSYGHVILDEAQDLSPMQCRAVGRRCATGSATVLGDLAQGTTPWATESWERTLAHLGKPVAELRAARIETLRQGYRVPRQILDYAARLLPSIAPDVGPPISVRQADGALDVRYGSDPRAVAVRASRDRLARDGSVGVIAADATAAAVGRALSEAGIAYGVLGDTGGAPNGDALAERLTVVSASLAKGLEFDHVIAVEPAEIVAGEARGLRRLYVVLTRAVSSLTVVHARELPDALRG